MSVGYGQLDFRVTPTHLAVMLSRRRQKQFFFRREANKIYLNIYQSLGRIWPI